MTFDAIGKGDASFYAKGLVGVPFSFLANGASDPATKSGPFLTSVTHTGTGAYTLVFGGAGSSGVAWKAVVGGSVVARDNSTTDIAAVLADPGVISGTTLTVKVVTYTRSTGAAVDIAANAGSWVRGVLWLKEYAGKDSTGL